MELSPNRQIPIPDADPEDRAPQLAAMVQRIDEELHIIKREQMDIRDFGAACDDVTDDSAAIQAAINYAGSTSATRGGAHVVIPDHTAIGSMVEIDRKSIVLRSLGWGRRGQSGVQPYLRWIGAAGSPMLRIKNVQGVQVRDLRLLGKSTAKPSCAISLYQVSGFGINQNVLENISIGDLIDDAIATGVGVVNGIAFEGATANNDTWYFENISINGCSGYVLRQTSNQNVNCIISKLTATDSANGMYIVGGEFTGRGWNFGAIADSVIYTPLLDDQSLNCYPSIHVIGLLAERSGRLLKMDGAGAVTIESGHFQRTNLVAADGRIVIADSANPNRIALSNFNLNSAGSGSPATEPYIDLTLSSYGNECFKELIVENVSLPAGGPSGNGIDARSLGVLDWKHIKYVPTSHGSSASYVTPQAFDVWIGGQFSAGESFLAPTTDIPARFRFSPTWYQAIASASDQILLDTCLRLISNRTGSPITLTSTPTIPVGRNGELLKIVNVGPTAITFQDESALSGSKLRLQGYGPSLTLGQYQSAEFLYLSTDQTGFENTNAWLLQKTSALGPHQPLDSDLTAIAALTTTAYGRALLALADAAAARTAIGSPDASNTPLLDAANTFSNLNSFGNVSLGNGFNLTWGGAYAAGIPTIIGVMGGSAHIQFRPAGSTSEETARLDATGLGIFTNSPTCKLDIAGDTVRLRTAKTPSSASDTGNAGDICWDSNYVYVCVATNTWKRTAIATW